MPVIGDRPELNLKTVIYATDFSPCSRNAGLYAARMAAYFSAKLVVTHAFTLEQAAMEVEVGDRHLSQQRESLTHLLYERGRSAGSTFDRYHSHAPGRRSGGCDSGSGGQA